MLHRFGSRITLFFGAAACLITSPVRANDDALNHEEDALVRNFLLGNKTAWKVGSFCFNTTLRGIDAKEIEWKLKLPGTDPKTAEERKYLKDLKFVSVGVQPLSDRVTSENGLDTGPFSVRPLKLEDCQTSATFRLHRVLTRKGTAFLSGVFATPCTGVPFGAIFRKKGGKWEIQHTAYYYSVMGPPGCSYISKTNAGEPADRFVILEKRPAD